LLKIYENHFLVTAIAYFLACPALIASKNVFYTLKKIGTIEKILGALFLIREMYLTGKQRFPLRRISSIFVCKLVLFRNTHSC